ncbi:hypothetical protein BDY21DRAFT_170935 [Lineolata rhizophorae]|uniref:E3 UFM1-protein ligase-like C-terminal domain-containing protein n=1 Tax=Lineolata rhizophorae TaxID=578093 RepID=A0A6A6PB73_9PEZI|nr:hypothetical protein BDY21DRAFT_170935 [Lineolata rhizophorae]
MEDMFSPIDLQEIFSTFPPTSRDLTPNTSQNAFVKTSWIPQYLEEKLSSSDGRLRLSELAREISLPTISISIYLHRLSPPILRGQDPDIVLSRSEEDSIIQRINEQLNRTVRSHASVARQYNLNENSLRARVAPELDTDGRFNYYMRNFRGDPADYFIKENFIETLKAFIANTMVEAHEIATPKTLSYHTEDPESEVFKELVLLVAKELQAEKEEFKGYGSVEEMDTEFPRFVPKTYLEKELNSLFDKLGSGEMVFCTVNYLKSTFDDLFRTPEEDIWDYLSSRAKDTIFLGDSIVSRAWFDNAVEECRVEVAEKGFANLANLLDPIPEDWKQRVFEVIGHKIEEFLGTDADTTGIEEIYPFFTRKDQFNQAPQRLFDATIQQAHEQWDQAPPKTSTECTINIEQIMESVANTLNLPMAIVQQVSTQELETGIKSCFRKQISELEAEADTQLAIFWRDRVLLRLRLYEQGLTTIDAEPKLQTQLKELLFTYVTKDMIPDHINKVAAKRLLRSATARKQTEKLRAGVKECSKTRNGDVSVDLQALHKLHDHFAAKLHVKAPNEADLVEGKESLIHDMIRSMNSDTDAPKLFLTLMVVLLSKRHDGLVYATGQFVPKLLKVLKKSMDNEKYERLDALKEAVKAGSLQSDAWAEMKKIAEEW